MREVDVQSLLPVLQPRREAEVEVSPDTLTCIHSLSKVQARMQDLTPKRVLITNLQLFTTNEIQANIECLENLLALSQLSRARLTMIEECFKKNNEFRTAGNTNKIKWSAEVKTRLQVTQIVVISEQECSHRYSTRKTSQRLFMRRDKRLTEAQRSCNDRLNKLILLNLRPKTLIMGLSEEEMYLLIRNK